MNIKSHSTIFISITFFLFLMILTSSCTPPLSQQCGKLAHEGIVKCYILNDFFSGKNDFVSFTDGECYTTYAITYLDGNNTQRPNSVIDIIGKSHRLYICDNRNMLLVPSDSAFNPTAQINKDCGCDKYNK